MYIVCPVVNGRPREATGGPLEATGAPLQATEASAQILARTQNLVL